MSNDGGPIHPHDCSKCVFLGTFSTLNAYDLYFCGGRAPTVIARFGSGPDYCSGLVVAKTTSLQQADDPGIYALRIAYLIAREVGLLRSDAG